MTGSVNAEDPMRKPDALSTSRTRLDKSARLHPSGHKWLEASFDTVGDESTSDVVAGLA